ncbi:unnamed protein product [Closterium sp. NIES-53]
MTSRKRTQPPDLAATAPSSSTTRSPHSLQPPPPPPPSHSSLPHARPPIISQKQKDALHQVIADTMASAQPPHPSTNRSTSSSARDAHSTDHATPAATADDQHPLSYYTDDPPPSPTPPPPSSTSPAATTPTNPPPAARSFSCPICRHPCVNAGALTCHTNSCQQNSTARQQAACPPPCPAPPRAQTASAQSSSPSAIPSATWDAHPFDTAAHLILLAFPRLVLRLTAAAPSQSLTTACAFLAQRFISGDWHALFLEASAAATLAARPLNLASACSAATHARLNRAAHFAKCGDWSRSLAALEAGEFAPPSPETISSLSSKHPPAPQPLPQWISTFTPDSYPQLSAPLLHLALRSAPRGTAAGPSGWLIEHLRDTFLSSQQHLPSLLRLFQNLLQGEFPLSVCSYYTASTLVALKKPQGGMRDTFLPCLQFGVAVPAGIEVMAHAVQSALSLHPDWAVLQLDVANAFNSFNKTAMFEALRSSAFSPLIPYFSLLCSSPSPLHYRNGPTLHTFESVSGVRQGDPCGPFLYAITQQLAILPTQNQFPSIFISSYADDTFLVGPPSTITAAFTALTNRLHSLGLTVQPSKCSIWCPLDWPQDCATPSGVPIAPNGLNVEGVPIGSDGYIISTVQEKLDSFAASLPLLHQLHDPQTASRILSQCVSARPSFLLRTVSPFPEIHDLFRSWDSTILDHFTQLFGPGFWILDTEQTKTAQQQVFLPIHLGGFGLRSSVSTAPLSYLCRWAHSLNLNGALLLLSASAFPFLTSALLNLALVDTLFSDSSLPSHALRCPKNNEPTRVHDAIKHELHRITLELGLVAQLEDHHLLLGRRPDITCRDIQAGSTLALDISVADLQQGFPHSNAATVMGSAAATRETEKTTLYASSMCARPDVKLLPFTPETFGCFGKS